MRNPLVRIEFFETYYYANVIHNILIDTSAFMRSLHEWHENQATAILLPPFQKWSILHNFSYFIIEGLIHETMEELPKSKQLWIEHALVYHKIQAISFQEWLTETNRNRNDINAVHDYHCELMLSGQFEELVTHLANEVFFLLFLLTIPEPFSRGSPKCVRRGHCILDMRGRSGGGAITVAIQGWSSCAGIDPVMGAPGSFLSRQGEVCMLQQRSKRNSFFGSHGTL